MSRSPRQQFFAGFRLMLPLQLGVFPFGMLFGVLALESGLTAWQAQLMSVLVLAGSSQIVLCQLLAAQAPVVVMLLTVAVINLRHLLYSASMAPHSHGLGRGWKILMAYLLTDEPYAVTIREFERVQNMPFRHWFFIGAGINLWLGWQLATLAGLLAGETIPASWGLDFALPLTFIAVVVPAARDRADWAAIVVAGTAALVFAALPYKLAILVAAVLGISAGMWMNRRRRR